jgi:hypothetical protein
MWISLQREIVALCQGRVALPTKIPHSGLHGCLAEHTEPDHQLLQSQHHSFFFSGKDQGNERKG